MFRHICAIAVATTLLLALSACGGDSTVLKSPGLLATGTLEGFGGSLSVDSGEFAGTTLTLPTGAISTGSSVSLSKHQDLMRHNSGVEAKSPAIEVQASRPEGTEYTVVQGGLNFQLKMPFDLYSAGNTGNMVLVRQSGEGFNPTSIPFAESPGELFLNISSDQFGVFQLFDRNNGQIAVSATGMSPISAAFDAEAAFSLYGSGFVNPLTVEINGTAIPDARAATTTRIDGTLPSSFPGNTTIVVTTPFGTTTYQNFTFTGDASPVVESITPAMGALAGEAVTIKGKHFELAPPVVTLNGIDLNDMVVVDDNTITGTAPASADAGLVDLRVASLYGPAVLSDGYRYRYADSDLLRIEGTDILGLQGRDAALALEGRYDITCFQSLIAEQPIGDAVLRFEPSLDRVRIEDRDGAVLFEKAYAAEGGFNSDGDWQIDLDPTGTNTLSITFGRLTGEIDVVASASGATATYDSRYKQVSYNAPALFANKAGVYECVQGTTQWEFVVNAEGSVTYSQDGGPGTVIHWDGQNDWIQWRRDQTIGDNADVVPDGTSKIYELHLAAAAPEITSRFVMLFDDRLKSGLHSVEIGGSVIYEKDLNKGTAAPTFINGTPDIFANYAGVWDMQISHGQGDLPDAVFHFATGDKFTLEIKTNGSVVISGQTFVYGNASDSWTQPNLQNENNVLRMIGPEYGIVIEIDESYLPGYQVAVKQLSASPASGGNIFFTADRDYD